MGWLVCFGELHCIPVERPHITTAVGPDRYLCGLRRRLASQRWFLYTITFYHHDNRWDEVWLSLLGLKRRDRDDVERGEANRTNAGRGASRA